MMASIMCMEVGMLVMLLAVVVVYTNWMVVERQVMMIAASSHLSLCGSIWVRQGPLMCLYSTDGGEEELVGRWELSAAESETCRASTLVRVQIPCLSRCTLLVSRTSMETQRELAVFSQVILSETECVMLFAAP
jgi:hypothetical protein